MTASDVYDALSKEIYSVLDNVKRPTIYRRDGLRTEIWTTEGSPAYSRRSTPPNGFEGVAWAMETLEFTGGGTVWKRAISSEDDVYLVTVKRRPTRK